jgi:hypothetical protein
VPGNPATSPPAKPPQKFLRVRGYLYRLVGRLHPSKRQSIRYYAHAGLAYHGRMHYTEGPQRSELFNRKPGRFNGSSADCSQYSASCAHWSGVEDVTDTDWTGTLGKKGKLIEKPVPGCFVFFGAPPYVHMGVMGRNGYVLGFGEQAGPDRNTLAALLAYFAKAGHPGHAFRDITRP